MENDEENDRDTLYIPPLPLIPNPPPFSRSGGAGDDVAPSIAEVEEDETAAAAVDFADCKASSRRRTASA